MRLFLVVLGGRTPHSHAELHDVRWVVGTSIDDTIPKLKRQWFGSRKGLHLDSYVEVGGVDDYSIRLHRTREPSHPLLVCNVSNLKRQPTPVVRQHGRLRGQQPARIASMWMCGGTQPPNSQASGSPMFFERRGTTAQGRSPRLGCSGRRRRLLND